MVIVGTFLPTYAQWSGMDASAHLRQRWYARLLGAIRLSLIMVWGVLRHPASAHPQGWMLVFALVWLGVVYGTLDGLFFTVMPVLAIQQMWEARGRGNDGAARCMRMGASMGASLVVTAAYHWGFVECCSTPIGLPLIGNAIITSGSLVTGNAITPLGAHIAMHMAAVLHGMETTV